MTTIPTLTVYTVSRKCDILIVVFQLYFRCNFVELEGKDQEKKPVICFSSQEMLFAFFFETSRKLGEKSVTEAKYLAIR